MKKLFAFSVLILLYACGNVGGGNTAISIEEASYQTSVEASCNSADVAMIPEKAFIDVPYVSQDPNYCGPASLSMVMGYYDDTIDQRSIGYDIVDSEGVTMDELIRKAKGYGFNAFSGTCQFNGLLKLLAENQPVIVRILSDDGTNGHFIVVTGYDNSLGIVYVNDPAQSYRTSISFDEFYGLWNITNLENNNSKDMIIMLSPVKPAIQTS